MNPETEVNIAERWKEFGSMLCSVKPCQHVSRLLIIFHAVCVHLCVCVHARARVCVFRDLMSVLGVFFNYLPHYFSLVPTKAGFLTQLESS